MRISRSSFTTLLTAIKLSLHNYFIFFFCCLFKQHTLNRRKSLFASCRAKNNCKSLSEYLSRRFHTSVSTSFSGPRWYLHNKFMHGKDSFRLNSIYLTLAISVKYLCLETLSARLHQLFTAVAVRDKEFESDSSKNSQIKNVLSPPK